MVKKGIALASCAVLLGGCVSGAQTTTYQVDKQLVAISDITGAVKCALALSLQHEKASGYPRLEGNVAAIEYIFQVVDTSSIGGNLSAEKAGPFVFAFSGGAGSILPKVGASLARTNTITTTIDGTLGLHYKDTAVCDAVPARVRAGLGFEKWLSRSIEQLNVQARYSPYGVVESLQLKANFGVVKSGNAGATFDFVFLGGDVSAMQSRNDVQTIQITLQPPSDKVKYPTVEVDGVTYGPPGGSPKVKRSKPKPASASAVLPALPKGKEDKSVTPKNAEAKKAEAPAQKSDGTCRTKRGLGCLDVPHPTE
ncbi:trypco2 family protein [Mesorhizobium dulcispinae]|uniref:trypco2 family protein n=1 Tax=Mesorhizobium dulcispinae TaxID=3072316 RepID=UPI002A240395|nr:trypco2 family protein [Mesorhizobium sp. VK23D]MDX8522075.1 trypco2 family protein [Mesorhizobium sp. VK23D]